MGELLRQHHSKDDVFFDHIGCIPGWNRVHSQQLRATDKGNISFRVNSDLEFLLWVSSTKHNFTPHWLTRMPLKT